jgi:hypothetical protein
MSRLLVVLAALFAIALAQSLDTADMNSLIDSYDNCHAYNDYGQFGVSSAIPPVVLFWTINTSGLNIGMNCYSPNPPLGWCGIGWKNGITSASMQQSDTNIVTIAPNGTGTITDFWIGSSNLACSSDPGQGACRDTSRSGTNDISNARVAVSLNGAKVSAQWIRPLTATDPNLDLPITPGTVQRILAAARDGGYTDPNNVNQHNLPDSGRAADSLDFGRSPQCPGTPVCSGVGTCKKGCCICQTGYGGLDCSNSGTSTNALALPNTIIPGYYTYGPIEIGMGLQIYWVLLNCGPLPYGVNTVCNSDLVNPNAIEIALISDMLGWVSFGVGKSMDDADVVVGSTTQAPADYRLTGRNQGVADCRGVCADDLIPPPFPNVTRNNVLASSTNTFFGKKPYVMVKFRRLLNTGDTVGDKIWSADENPVIWARSRFTSFNQHGNHRFDRNTLKINFRTGNYYYSVDTSTVHGWLMFLAWCVFAPAAAFIARFMKLTIGHPWWFHIHRALALFAVLLSFIGFVIILTWVQDYHFRLAHSQLGLFMVIVSFLNPVLGVLADVMVNPSREHTPLFPDLLHWIFGWSLVILGVVNVYLGLSRYEVAPLSIWILYALWAFLLLFVNFGFLIFNVANGKTGMGGHRGMD